MFILVMFITSKTGKNTNLIRTKNLKSKQKHESLSKLHCNNKVNQNKIKKKFKKKKIDEGHMCVCVCEVS